jgi:Skp family chaperone for outer membrane proteins
MREFKSRIRRFDETRRKQLEDQSRRMRQRIVEEITQTVEQYARDKGLLSVVDSSGHSLNGVPVVLFADAKLDITDEIIDLLNKETE